MNAINTIGLIGLGKMGFNLALNMERNGFTVFGYDVSQSNVALANEKGVESVHSLQELVAKLPSPKVVWSMVPAGAPTEQVIQDLSNLLNEGDIVIDGGNAFYKDSIRRNEQLKAKGIHFLDCGTSGGTSGALEGACTMVGGERAIFDQLEPLFKTISIENGYLYTGAAGSGHFVKMVHNGIEYGMMQAIGEGFELLKASGFEMDFEKVARVWNHGSVIRSWLMELTESAFSKDENLDAIKGIVHASGEGQWSVETALDLGVPVPIMVLSLMMRHRSQQADTFSGKVVAALRNEFGGHAVVKE